RLSVDGDLHGRTLVRRRRVGGGGGGGERWRRQRRSRNARRGSAVALTVDEALEHSGRGKWIALVAAGIALVAVAVVSLGLLRQRSYAQNSPEELLSSARQMVLDGRADRLPELVWPGDPGMRPVLKRVGRLLGNLQELGRT